MNMNKHTPGPWRVVKYPATEDTANHAVLAKAEDDSRDVTVATVFPISDDGQAGGESSKNAALIAAAPELLAALCLCVEELRHYEGTDSHGQRMAAEAVMDAEDAIAKAEGGEA